MKGTASSPAAELDNVMSLAEPVGRSGEVVGRSVIVAKRTSWFGVAAGLSEVILILLLGNLIAAPILSMIFTPEQAALADDFAADSFYGGAAVSAVSLSVRFGLMMVLGFGLI